MLYVVGIKKLKNDSFLRGTVVYFDNVDNLRKLRQYAECCFYVYNSVNHTVLALDKRSLVTLYKSGKKIKGVACETKEGYKLLRISVIKPNFTNLIKLREKVPTFKQSGVLNPYFLQQCNLPSNTIGIIVGENVAHYPKTMLRLDNWRKSLKTYIIKNIDDVVKKYIGTISYIGNVVVVDKVLKNNEVIYAYNPEDVTFNVIESDITSVMDLYWMSIIAPQTVVGCNVVSETEFILDTLTDRYIFDVKSGLRNYVLKCKLLNKFYFDLR